MENLSYIELMIEVILAVAGLCVMILTPFAVKLFGLKNGTIMNDRIKGGIDNVVRAALADGETNVSEILNLASDYVRSEFAESAASMQPSDKAVETLVKASVHKHDV